MTRKKTTARVRPTEPELAEALRAALKTADKALKTLGTRRTKASRPKTGVKKPR